MYAIAELNAILKYAGILASSAREDLLPEKINLKVNTFTYYKSFFLITSKLLLKKTNLVSLCLKKIGGKLLQSICKIKINLCLLIVLIKT